MFLSSLTYALFLPAVAAAYFLVPKRLQNLSLLAASLLFYFLNLPSGVGPLRRYLPLLVLTGTIVFVWQAALSVDRAQGRARTRRMALAAALCIAVLCFFKYCGFVLPTLLGIAIKAPGLPLGISFFTFAALGYLFDVGRGTVPAEKSLLTVAVFLSFFPTMVSGPICRAGALMPQLAAPRKWDGENALYALRTGLEGIFRQVAVANVLGLMLNYMFDRLDSYAGLTVAAMAALYAFQLYFEFSGYSLLARASARLLGLDIPRNFKAPYFATNFSGFWQRWHISLSTWLQDYLFTPLVWSRWPARLPLLGRYFTAPPVLSSLVAVFFVSGLWHGNTLPYVVWGLLQGVFRVGEEVLHRRLGKPKKKQSGAKAAGKRVAVFALWSMSLLFFRVGLLPKGTVGQAFAALGRLFAVPSLQTLGADFYAAALGGFYAKPVMAAAYFAFLALVLALALYMDYFEYAKNAGESTGPALARLGPVPRWLCYYCLIGLVLVAFILQSGGYGGAVSMAYANF